MNNTCKWRKSPIFPDYYSVSENGEVKSERNGKILKPGIDKDGYHYYVLCVNGSRKTIKAHRLVAMVYVDNPDNKPAIDHINGIKTDNRAENIRWVTNKENSHNPITLTKLRENAKVNVPKLIAKSIERDFGRHKTVVYKAGQVVGIFNSQAQAAEFAGVSEGKVSQCIAGAKTSCKGYAFKRLED